MNTRKPISQWRIVAASVCGTSHLKTEQSCQDAHRCQVLPNNVLVVATADGAGSARQGEMGAKVAVNQAIEYLSTQAITLDILSDDQILRELLTQSMLAAKSAVEDEAVKLNYQPRDLATTLIVMIATPKVVAVAQIGDGLAVAQDSKGNLLALTTPDHGEYINETTFLTNPHALQSVQMRLWREDVVNIGVLTDGLQMLALNMVVGKPHEPFFLPLFNFVAQTDDKTIANEQLVRFLSSERITHRTDDDLTLVIAAFSN